MSDFVTRPKMDWFRRVSVFWFVDRDGLPGAAGWHHGAPDGFRVCAVYLLTGDERAYLSHDGNWHIDPAPVYPSATFDEVVARLSAFAIAPPLVTVEIDGERCVSFGLWCDPRPGNESAWSQFETDGAP